MEPANLLEYFRNRQSEMLSTLETYVNYETPSSDKSLLDKLALHFKQRFSRITDEVKIINQQKFGNHLKIVFKNNRSYSNRPALILCHFDTVWPEGTTKDRPFLINKNKAFGPGVLDMKGGIVLVEYALCAIQDLRIDMPRPVIVLLNSDEEIGSDSSRAMIEEHALKADYVLVPESPLPNGVLKTARKGTGRFLLDIVGRAAHSGVEPEKGINANTELAFQILYLDGLNDPETGTSINVGVVQGGTKVNVISPRASAEVDVRIWTEDEMKKIEDKIFGIKAKIPGIKINVEGGFDRPPMERTKKIADLFEKAKKYGQSISLDLEENSTGGASDGNFTAALGIPTLDGLGPVGEGAHAESEYIEIDSLPARAALLTLLLANL